MPKIAAIKQIDGETWVRVEEHLIGYAGCITIWTDAEVIQHDKELRASLMEQITEVFNKL